VNPSIAALPRACLALILIGTAFSFSLGRAQDTITIPKSRLEELEKKEAELKKLQGDLDKSKGENVKLQKEVQQEKARAVKAEAASSAPVIQHTSPPIDSLPPLREGETVNAMDLANYFRNDPAAAEKRFGKQKIEIQGEIIGFSKRLFSRYYQVHLLTPFKDMKLICEVYPPDTYQATATANGDTEIQGLIDASRITLAKAGQTAQIRGVCKGLEHNQLWVTGCVLVKTQ
jgi:hypothetical protein